MALLDIKQRGREIVAAYPAEVKARIWRDGELKSTDYIVSLMDFTPHQDWLTYRTELRDWPSTDQFPGTRPVRPNQPTPTGY